MKQNHIGGFASFFLVLLLGLLLQSLQCSKRTNNIGQARKYSQDSISKAVMHKNKVFTEYEEMPKFPGGEDAIKKIVKENIRIPEKVAKAGIRGRIIISFVVMKNGFIDLEKDHVRYYNRLKDKLGNPCNDSILIKLCEDEAYRVLTWIPRWIPGKQNGEPIDVKFSLPIVFGN